MACGPPKIVVQVYSSHIRCLSLLNFSILLREYIEILIRPPDICLMPQDNFFKKIVYFQSL
jgi:hypothetical protein